MEQTFKVSNPRNHDEGEFGSFPGDLPKSETLMLAKYILESNQQKADKFLEEQFDEILIENVIRFPVKNEANSKSLPRETVESSHRIEDAGSKDTLIEMREVQSHVPLVVNVQMNILHLALCIEYEGIEGLLSKMSEKMSTRELECMEEEIKNQHTPSIGQRNLSFKGAGIAGRAVSAMKSRAISRRSSASSLKEAK